MHALVGAHPRHAARAGHVEQHAAREDALLLREDVAVGEPARGRDHARLAAVVDILAAVNVSDGIEVREGEAVHVERERIDRADGVVRLVTHRVAHGLRIVGRLVGVEVTRDREHAARAHQRRRSEAGRRRDVVERAELVIAPPAAGVVELIEERIELALGWKDAGLGHVGLPAARLRSVDESAATRASRRYARAPTRRARARS